MGNGKIVWDEKLEYDSPNTSGMGIGFSGCGDIDETQGGGAGGMVII